MSKEIKKADEKEVLKADAILELDILVTKIEHEGKKFNAYKTFQKNGKKIDVKFTRDVKNAPEENCIIVVEAGKMNLDKNRRFPCLWVREIKEVKQLPDKNNDPRKLEEITELFGFDDEDLPF